MAALRQLAADLWVAKAPMTFYGLPVGTRMTVVRLTTGALWLHSPVAPTPELQEAVTALGPVTYLVAPNKFHHMFIAPWRDLFPQAQLFLAPGLAQKRPDLAGRSDTLAGEAPSAWAEELEQVCVDGIPMLREVVFFHRASRTLLLTDLAFNFRDDAPWLTRLVISLFGKMNTLAPTVLERLATRDRLALRASLRRILALPFERVVVPHGEVVEVGGREQLEAGYAWALREAR